MRDAPAKSEARPLAVDDEPTILGRGGAAGGGARAEVSFVG
jgi:hypothetical protein